MSKVNVKIERELARTVRDIAKAKFPLRGLEFFSDSIREALLEWAEENEEFYLNNNNQEDQIVDVNTQQ
jgi:hypothetical protein